MKITFLNKSIKLSYFASIISLVNVILYHLPFYKFVIKNINLNDFNGYILLFSLVLLAIALNALLFYIILFSLRNAGKWVIVLLFIINSIAVYFINTYGVIIEESMIGNILNTNYEESAAFFSFSLIGYILFLGIIPSILIFKIKAITLPLKKFLIQVSLALVFILSLAYANSANWLWIDKNSKTLGGLAMPWSYLVNLNLFLIHKNQQNQEQILLPNFKIKDNQKSIVVLVIGESARRKNFSLYGYEKVTNPLLSKIKNVYSYKAESCATYTSAGVKCILDYQNSNKPYEILPNYLNRNDIDVIWRTTNWGEPPVKIKNYQNGEYLKKQCKIGNCEYDEVLLADLKEQILACKKNKILIVLHTSTSHGPTYFSKYPPQFNKFTPVCKSVELTNCTQEDLTNAYDNTIVYTDYILATLIGELKQLPEYNSSMLYISDHGESLGENNLYMHGIPASIAPKEQLEIPFIVWLSNDKRKLKENKMLSQHHVFHSVLDFLAIDSPIFDEKMTIFQK